ncbi:helix-turn-helix domain-containing protein [Desemzia sp. FAM 24101]|uniref:helix-turn-helix domain-containing protein n=1 Tax=unclassified Desemzia TaxID=2685243 RepID=UPI00388428C4
MIELELTQNDLVKLTGIGKSSISQYVSGKNTPSDKNLKILAAVLNVLVSYFRLENDKNMEDPKNGNIPISIAAKKLGKSEQFVRVGLQRGMFDFGYAVKMSSKFTYHISPKKFYDYIGLIQK